MCELLAGLGVAIMIFAVPFLIVGILTEEWGAVAGAVIAIWVSVFFIGAGGAIYYEAKAEADHQHEQHYEQKYEEPQCTCGCTCKE